MSRAGQAGWAAAPWLKRRSLEIAGWLLVAAGLAALVLPGPGMLLLAAGFALLALRHRWARRLSAPIKARAFRLAAYGVRTVPRIVASVVGALLLVAAGLLWGLGGSAPRWWPVDDRWWLFGGWGTGITMIASGVIALALVVFSVHRLRCPPDHFSREDD